ncbi:GIN domain-containing protein [Sphingomonas sp.]|uniref:GIN domain-containing protein n=1 Tax=Sphingomonas sp. TaxID=28214 RepID=UPI00286AF1B1|nr:DUF2807 domain-containing protein [Sphingomonas sp.]
MNKLILAALLLASAPATAADRNFGVSGFDRVRVDGDYKVNLIVGVAPFARASGSSRALDPVDVVVEGRTLIVRANRSASWGGYPGESAGPVEVSIGTHDLTAAFVNGAGSLNINQVRGLKFEASAQGAGSIAIDKVDVDQFQLGLAGAASARLAGKALKLTAIVRGTSALDGEALSVKDAVIGATGPAIIKLTATGTAKVDAIGVASVSLIGKPACSVTIKGSASVSGCRSTELR